MLPTKYVLLALEWACRTSRAGTASASEQKGGITLWVLWTTETTASWQYQGNLRNLKRFVNSLSRDCHVGINCDVSTAYFKSSSVFRLFNNRRKLGWTKKRIAFLELSFWPLKLKAKMVKISVSQFYQGPSWKNCGSRSPKTVHLTGNSKLKTSWSEHLSENICQLLIFLFVKVHHSEKNSIIQK